MVTMTIKLPDGRTVTGMGTSQFQLRKSILEGLNMKDFPVGTEIQVFRETR